MKENKTKNIPVREAYEPMELKVLKVSPEGVLCQSGGGGDPVLSINSYINNDAI